MWKHCCLECQLLYVSLHLFRFCLSCIQSIPLNATSDCTDLLVPSYLAVLLFCLGLPGCEWLDSIYNKRSAKNIHLLLVLWGEITWGSLRFFFLPVPQQSLKGLECIKKLTLEGYTIMSEIAKPEFWNNIWRRKHGWIWGLGVLVKENYKIV